jgi:hypothetical protein
VVLAGPHPYSLDHRPQTTAGAPHPKL